VLINSKDLSGTTSFSGNQPLSNNGDEKVRRANLHLDACLRRQNTSLSNSTDWLCGGTSGLRQHGFTEKAAPFIAIECVTEMQRVDVVFATILACANLAGSDLQKIA
jgi:hypothetical protein